jgi:orotidine 5'-phosphate decarboxylase subfamily 1
MAFKDHILASIIETKKTNLILSLDIDDEAQFFKLIGDCATFICGVKIHSDILSFTDNYDFYDKLFDIATKENFIVIEDRKLADIGYINRLQAIYYRNRHIHYLTCHSFMGRDAIEAIPSDINLFLIADMSCSGAKINSDTCVPLFIDMPNVIGFVSQYHKTNIIFPRLPFYLRPGIKLIDHGHIDGHGQIYQQPDKYPGVLWVVGRDITLSAEPRRQAAAYQQLFNSEKTM